MGRGVLPEDLRKPLERALGSAAHTIADVSDLVITHYHTDHMGNAAAIQAASGCAIWGHRRVDEFLAIVSDPLASERQRRAHPPR